MSAVISDCGKYRYTLKREWMTGAGTCLFIMLNPSTADAEQDDPTIRRCIGFAQRWGCQRLAVVNLFAYRATEPSVLLNVENPVGPENDRYIGELLGAAKFRIAAWGSSVRHLAHRREAEVIAKCKAFGFGLDCLAVTKDGFPRHPLYMPNHLERTPFVRIAEAA